MVSDIEKAAALLRMLEEFNLSSLVDEALKNTHTAMEKILKEGLKPRITLNVWRWEHWAFGYYLFTNDIYKKEFCLDTPGIKEMQTSFYYKKSTAISPHIEIATHLVDEKYSKRRIEVKSGNARSIMKHLEQDKIIHPKDIRKAAEIEKILLPESMFKYKGEFYAVSENPEEIQNLKTQALIKHQDSLIELKQALKL